jgi:hypothetical protein
MDEKNELTPDLSRVVNLIMQNPKLIEEISNLVAKDSGHEPKEEATASLPEKEDAEKVSFEPTYTTPQSGGRERRAHLLGALKPYVSKERARAIDSMISIVDMLDMMKAR